MGYCSECGQKAPEDAAFCEDCGQALGDVGDSSPVNVPTSVPSAREAPLETGVLAPPPNETPVRQGLESEHQVGGGPPARLIWVALIAIALVGVGSTVRIGVAREQVAYSTTRSSDATMWAGDEKVTVAGQPGERVRRSLTILGSVLTIGESVARKPVDAVVSVGTKPRDITGSYTEMPDGGFMASFGKLVDGIVITNVVLGSQLNPSTNEVKNPNQLSSNEGMCLSFEAHAMEEGASAPDISVTVVGPSPVTYGPSPTLSATRQSRCGFTIKKPPNGWVAGNYTVTVLVNGKSAYSTSFQWNR